MNEAFDLQSKKISKIRCPIINHSTVESAENSVKTLYFWSYKNNVNRVDNLQNAAYKLTFLNPAGYVMHQQFDIQQLYVLPTLYLCVLYLSENKQRLVPLTA